MNGMNKKGIWHAKAVEMSQNCLNALLRTETAIAQKLAQFAEGDDKSPCEQGLSIDPVDLTVVLQALGVIEEIHNLRYADRQARGLPAKAGDDIENTASGRGRKETTMTLDQKLTIQVALAVYAEHCKEAMRLFKGEEMKAYYQKELGRVQEAKTAVEAMGTDHFDETEKIDWGEYEKFEPVKER